MWRTWREEVLPLICEDTGVQASLNSLCSSRNRRGRFDPCGYQGLLRRADAKPQTQDSTAKNVQINKTLKFVFSSKCSEFFCSWLKKSQITSLMQIITVFASHSCCGIKVLHKFGEKIHLSWCWWRSYLEGSGLIFAQWEVISIYIFQRFETMKMKNLISKHSVERKCALAVVLAKQVIPNLQLVKLHSKSWMIL